MIPHVTEGSSVAPVNSVAELRTLIQSKFSPEYTRRMLHTVPVLEQLPERQTYLTARATGKRVLDIGCTGPLAKSIQAVASVYRGVDKEQGAWTVLDLDTEPAKLPVFDDIEVVIASEVLEHLSNPGSFLKHLSQAYPGISTYVTVPNAGAYQIYKGCEMVNDDHVAWYSYTTLSTLLTRYSYRIVKGFWYNGQAHKSEGLLVEAITG